MHITMLSKLLNIMTEGFASLPPDTAQKQDKISIAFNINRATSVIWLNLLCRVTRYQLASILMSSQELVGIIRLKFSSSHGIQENN